MESRYSLKFRLVEFLMSKSQTFALRSRSVLVAAFLENVESRWFLNHKKLSARLWFFVFKVMFSSVNLAFAYKSHNKQFKQIRNAWQFGFAVGFAFMAQCGRFCIELLTT